MACPVSLLAALAEPPGELRSAKVARFVVLMGLAVANKWQLGPAMPAGAAKRAEVSPIGGRRVGANRGRAHDHSGNGVLLLA